MEPEKSVQNLTQDRDFIDEQAIKNSLFVLTPQQQSWIDYKAISGIVYNRENESMRKMSVAEFARKVGVSRETLYEWRNQIPNFWERVAERRKEMHKTEWLAKMHEKWKIKALGFDNWQITEAWLINFDPDYKSPKLKVEHEIGDSLADALNIARERRAREQRVIEGELVDGQPDA